MSPSLRVPKGRPRGNGSLFRLLFLVAGLTILALIWADRRTRGQGNQSLGTAPAGVPPMPERDQGLPTPQATPGSASGATASTATVTSASRTAGQPEAIRQAAGSGAIRPERRLSVGPDVVSWADSLTGDTEGDGAPAEPAAAPAAESIPTPAAESTTISADEGKDWIEVSGTTDCPPKFPVKGNATSRIYHLPGEPTYEATVPEICFATEAAAMELGYRAQKG